MTEDSLFEAAFRDAFAARFAPLYRYLNRLTGDPELASDIAQQAFVRLFERGMMPDDPRVWLVTVAHNLFRDERRRSARRRRLLARRTADTTIADAAPAPDEAVLTAEQRATARAALARLSTRERQLLLLRYEGYSYAELAAATHVEPTSVGTLLARATVAFRRAVEGEGHASR